MSRSSWLNRAVTSRQAAWLTVGVLIVLFIALAWLLIPWGAAGPGQRGEQAVSADFTPSQVEAQREYHRQLRPWTLSSFVLGLLLTVVLGLTPFGARIVELVARPLGYGWVWRAVLGGVALGLLGQLLVLPLRARAEVVLRRHGLSTQSWSGWALDIAKSWAIGVLITSLALLTFYAVVRAMPNWWWVPVSVGAVALTFIGSFLYPVLIEPVFNQFHSMEKGALRTELMTMAERDGVPVKDVLVADASRRTTALNAYVSGFGSSRRIVVYDTLLKDAPDNEVALVVAHELGHAKRNDVLVGTSLAAVGVAIVCVAGFLMLGWRPLLTRAGVSELGDPRSMALVMALLAIVSFLGMPAANFVSRRVEARADEHSLRLVDDPSTFIAMHRRLAVTNRSNLHPNPVLYVLFASHPATTERLGHARDYAKRHGIPLAASAQGKE